MRCKSVGFTAVLLSFLFQVPLAQGALAAEPGSGGSVEEEAPPLVTDRPDFTESSSAVPRSRLQLEIGSEVAGGGGSTNVVPVSVLARYGIARVGELRLGTTPMEATFAPGEDGATRGLADVTVGGKLADSLAEGLRAGVIPWTKLERPTTGATVSSGAIATVALDAGGPVSLAANFGGSYLFDSGASGGFQGRGSVASGIGITRDFGTFVELYATVRPPGPMRLFADTGVTYLLTPHLQLDGYVAAGLPEFQRFSGGLGVSFLL